MLSRAASSNHAVFQTILFFTKDIMWRRGQRKEQSVRRVRYGRMIKSLTVSHKMVCQALVTAITHAPLMHPSPAPPHDLLGAHHVSLMSQRLPTAVADFIHASPADVI